MSSATDATFQADQGTPDQLPQGAATELNAALPTQGTVTGSATQKEADAASAQALQPIQRATQADYQPQYQPQSEADQTLFDPTTRPDEPLLAGLNQDRMPPPGTSLPLLLAMANDPNAPPQLQILVDQLLYFLNQAS